tara:strand:- start:113 stop:388 length:276 start_codon:yes stop_codon:yes gene_type:complete
VLSNTQLLLLNYGIFALHASLMALWLMVPLSLRQAGLVKDDRWQVYLPVLVLSMQGVKIYLFGPSHTKCMTLSAALIASCKIYCAFSLLFH